MGAPIGHTCPDINKALKHIKHIREELKGSEFEKPLDHDLCQIEDILEDLRRSNDILRGWGEDMEDKNNELEIKLGNAEDELYALQEAAKS